MTFQTREEVEKRIRSTMRGNMKKATPVNGTFKFVVTRADLAPNPSKGGKDGNGAGCLNLPVNAAPLADPDDASTVQMQFETVIWLALPIVNPAVEGHKVDADTEKRAYQFFSAVAPDRVEYVPAKLPSGEWDNRPETAARKQRALVESAMLATDIAEGTFKLEDLQFVGTTKVATGDRGGYFINGTTDKLLPGQAFSTLTEKE